MIRSARLALLGLVPGLLALLPACGGSAKPSRVVVELVSALADGAPPAQGWRLRAKGGREHPLTQTGEKGPDGLLYAADAPAGTFDVVGPSSWSTILGTPSLALVSGGVPGKVGVGREGSLYLQPPGGRTVSGVAVFTLAGAGEPETRLEVEADLRPDRVAVIRFPKRPEPDARLRIAATFDDGTFAEPARVILRSGGPPPGVRLPTAEGIAVDVRFLGLSVPEGSRLVAEVSEDGLVGRAATVLQAAGRARFERLPVLRGGATFRLGSEGDGASWSLTRDDVRTGDLPLFVGRLGAAPAPASWAVEWTGKPPGTSGGHLQARLAGVPTYGIVDDRGPPFGEPGTTFRLLWTGPETASLADVETVVPAAATPVASVRIERGPTCRVRCGVSKALPTGRRYALLARRAEGTEWVLAHGFVLRGLATGDQELLLPPGRYRLALEVLGREGPSVEVLLGSPGARANLTLEPPP